MNQPVILCGLGRVGWRVLETLQAANLPVVVIDNIGTADDPRLAGVRLIRGDCRQRAVLEQAGLANSRGVLVLTSDDLINISTALMVRHMQPDVRIVVRMFNQNLLSRLGKAVQNVFALSVSALTAPLLALTALTGEALGTFGQGDAERQVAEVTIDDSSHLLGRTVGEAANRHRFQALAYFPAQGEGRLLLEVDPDARLSPGDRLFVCGVPADLASLVTREDDGGLPGLLWAGSLRRHARVLARTFGEIDLPVKICGGVLVAVLFLSTCVYTFGIGKSWPDGLYRTVSLIATGADMHGEELIVGWQKVFVSFLRIFGAAVTAAFTAIVTNYLIRARLGAALEIRRIPDGGHVIVCGLGNVGFRVVEELVQRGAQVVAIERTAGNHFIPTARRLGVGVIVGDATVPEVLRQAQAGTARAVLAVTSDELANLEIALLARELNPRQRVVLRLSDPYLAQTLRDAANVRLALSTSALAAPAFLAALFGDRVQNIFLVQGQALAAVELVVHKGDALLDGQSVRALAIDYHLLPVTLVAADQAPRSQPLNHRLGVDDRLTAILALPDLVRLLRRERVPANCTVDITGFPLPAKGWVHGLLRTQRQLTVEDADKALEQLPVSLGCNLTRGQAEDLLVMCRRERVNGTLHIEGINGDSKA